MKATKWQKFMSALLTLTMIFSLCGTTAFAASDVAPPNEVTETQPTDNSAGETVPEATPTPTPEATPTPTPEATPTPVPPKNPSIVIPGQGGEPVIDEDVSADEPLTAPPVLTVDAPTTVAETMPFPTKTAANAMEVMRFEWNGVEQIVKTNSSNSISGCSWNCDGDGNFTVKFSSNGTFTLTSGYIDSSNATVIGGGAGGNHAELRKGGSGGGAGEQKSGTIKLTAGTSITITIGVGGTGGTVSSSISYL